MPVLRISTIKHPRGIDQSVMMKLIACDWVRKHQNIIITGPTGAGKTFLACALTNKACREGYRSSLHPKPPGSPTRWPWPGETAATANTINKLARAHVLVIDDLGLAPMTDAERRDLLEVVEERHGHASTIVASQLPVDHWHEQIGDPTIADAILDRLIHNAHKINHERRITEKKICRLDLNNRL